LQKEGMTMHITMFFDLLGNIQLKNLSERHELFRVLVRDGYTHFAVSSDWQNWWADCNGGNTICCQDGLVYLVEEAPWEVEKTIYDAQKFLRLVA